MDVSDPSNPVKAETEIADPASGADHANVFELFRPFDPMSEEAEPQYDVVVQRINQARIRLLGNELERNRLERQFVENDLVISEGPDAGTPLSIPERRKRIRRLVELGVEAERLIQEEQFATRALARMNEELDRWARETYGP